jgi:hypothetical protein
MRLLTFSAKRKIGLERENSDGDNKPLEKY